MPHTKLDHPHRRAGDRTRLTRVRDYFNRPGPWIVIAFVVLFIVMILGGVTYTREQSDRAARFAAAKAEYQQCLGSIPILKKTQAFISGVQGVGAVLLANSIRMHNATRPTDGTEHLYEVQQTNIDKLRRALRDQRGLRFPAPTRAECLRQYELRRAGKA